mgnify:CR=1 FL=1
MTWRVAILIIAGNFFSRIAYSKEFSVQTVMVAEAKGKIAAKDINNQRYADQTYGLIKPISDSIKESTGSGLGTKVDQLAGVFGVGTKGAAAKAQLDVLNAPYESFHAQVADGAQLHQSECS